MWHQKKLGAKCVAEKKLGAKCVAQRRRMESYVGLVGVAPLPVKCDRSGRNFVKASMSDFN